MNRFLIAGTNSGCGKTTIATGIMAALSERMKTQPFKVGPDFIDPAYHTFVTGRESSNLDGWMLPAEEVKKIFIKNAYDADVSVIEGVMGMYDGFGIEKNNGSGAHIAKILNAPAVLVIDGKSISLSAAALVKGFKEFDDEVNFAGVIINNIMGEKHYRLLRDSIEKHCGVKVFGYLPANKDIELPSRHLGLIPSCEIQNLRAKIDLLKRETEKYIDLDALLKISQHEWKGDAKYIPETKIINVPVKIGIAKDKAFNFYYKDNLDLLKELGGEPVEFSPLNDERIPDDIDALYFGGGFPEVFAEELEQNETMKESIREQLSNGMPYLAECGGLMYLCEGLINFDGHKYNMTGWFDFDCEMTKRLQRFGYNELTLKNDSILGKKGEVIRTHEFHRSAIIENSSSTLFSLKKKTHYDLKEWECGYIKNNGVAGYPHFHFGSNKNFAKEFVRSADKFRSKRCRI